MQVITWQAPSGSTLSICPGCERALAGRWPKDHSGQEYCQVSHGLHDGICEVHWTTQFRAHVEDLKGLGITLPDVARLLGISLSSLEKRLAGDADPRQGELIALQMLAVWKREYERGNMPLARQAKGEFEEYVAQKLG